MQIPAICWNTLTIRKKLSKYRLNMSNFTAHTEQERQEMLSQIGLSSVKELYKDIPDAVRIHGLSLPDELSEQELTKEIKKLAEANKIDYACFLGAGAAKRFIPAAVTQVSSRFEFNTAYTPYQAEISQGTLQAIYEYQSIICNLTGMDVSNASMYDAATACAEAILMAARITGRKKALVCKRINPQYRQVINTYAEAADIEISDDLSQIGNDIACVLLQTPDYYGAIHDVDIVKEKIADEKTMLICCCDILSLSVLVPPKCDIMVGNLQPAGNNISFGGPYAAYFACLDKYKRQIPGRVVGRTVDKDGNQAFCLTLQTREQHIRREKATSNICSNQSLVALQSLIYFTLLGESGIKQITLKSVDNAHKLAKKLVDKGFEIQSKNFFNEFVLKVKNADSFLENLKENKILGGIKLDENRILVCATEMNSDEEIENYVYFAV